MRKVNIHFTGFWESGPSKEATGHLSMTVFHPFERNIAVG
jgi:hypothetical protein